MRRHVECNYVILLIIELEVGRVVAVVAVEDKEAMNANYSTFNMFIKVLNPF